MGPGTALRDVVGGGGGTVCGEGTAPPPPDAPASLLSRETRWGVGEDANDGVRTIGDGEAGTDACARVDLTLRVRGIGLEAPLSVTAEEGE